MRVTPLCAGLALMLGTGAAMAQVTVFGRFNQSVEYVHTGESTDTVAGQSQWRVPIGNSNKLGFKGEEELSPGTKAFFLMDFSPKDTGITSSRDTYAGLKNNTLGGIRLGRNTRPFNDPNSHAEIFDGVGAQANWAIASNGNAGDSIDYDRRQNNSVMYTSPNWDGLTFNALYGALDESSAGNGKAYSLATNYLKKGWGLSAAYEKRTNAGADKAPTSPAALRYTKPIGKNDSQGLKLGGNVDIGDFNLGALYTYLEYKPDAGGTLRRNFFVLTGKYKITGNGTIQAQAEYVGEGKGSVADGTSAGWIVHGKDTGAKVFTLGYEHRLSKRTTLYTYVHRINNEANASYGFGHSAYAIPGPGSDYTLFSLGMQHHF